MHRSKFVPSFLAALALASAATQSHAQTLTTLASLNGSNQGAAPMGSLTLSADGSTLFGTAIQGGFGYNGFLGSGDGTIFSVPAVGGTPTVLTSFDGADGQTPTGGVVLAGGTLYGTAEFGNSTAIYSVPVTGGAPTNLATFPNGESVNSLTLVGSTLYGTTPTGGAYGDGSVFSIPVGGGGVTTISSFSGSIGTGPVGGLTLSADGSTLYGMTLGGPADNDGVSIFSVPLTGGAPTILGSILESNGLVGVGSLLLVGSTLYGTTYEGGYDFEVQASLGDGTIFSVPVTGGVPTTLFEFNGTDGEYPNGGLTRIGSTLYGTTEGRGLNEGSIFSFPLSGGTATTLFSFNGTDSARPSGDLALGGLTLYGATVAGGADSAGTVFALILPEPSSLLLLSVGAIGLGAFALRRNVAERAR